MSLKKLFYYHTCESCHQEFHLTDTIVKEEKDTHLGMNITVVRHYCPKCNAEVQVSTNSINMAQAGVLRLIAIIISFLTLLFFIAVYFSRTAFVTISIAGTISILFYILKTKKDNYGKHGLSLIRILMVIVFLVIFMAIILYIDQNYPMN